jgi:hypothetical protein
MEFANGNYALLAAAADYASDTTAPVVSVNGPSVSATPFDVTFDQSEAADIYYTTDGSTPTTGSTRYGRSHARALPAPIHIGGTTTLRWLASDFKGNTSTGSKTLYLGTQQDGGVGGTVPATLSLSLGAPASFGAFTPGLAKDYTATTTATVTSTAGDGTLSVSDPGHLTNGRSACRSRCRSHSRRRRGAAPSRTGSRRSASSRRSAPTTRCAPAATRRR